MIDSISRQPSSRPDLRLPTRPALEKAAGAPVQASASVSAPAEPAVLVSLSSPPPADPNAIAHPATPDPLEKALADRQVADGLKGLDKTAAGARKALLRQRLEMARNRLKVIKAMGAGSPAKTAAATAEVIREAAAIARAYRSAGKGDPVDLGVAGVEASAGSLNAASTGGAQADPDEPSPADIRRYQPAGWVDDDKFDATPDGKFFREIRSVVVQGKKVIDEAQHAERLRSGTRSDRFFKLVREQVGKAEEVIVETRNQLRAEAQLPAEA